MYDFPSPLIAGVLFVCIVLANEAGLHLGEYYQRNSDEDLKSQTTAIQGGIIGILALLLGFTFNMSLNRFDARSEAEVREANAIGTALLRAKLLPSDYSEDARATLREYVDVRLEVSDIDLTETSARQAYVTRGAALQDRLWAIGLAASETAPNPVRTGYFVQSLNEVIDAQGARNAQLQRHVPAPVLYLLFVMFVATSALTGYSSGLGTRNSRFPALVLSALICVLVFIIVDLDRPRRGVIEVRQDSMEALRG